jgi:hypothetical protein
MYTSRQLLAQLPVVRGWARISSPTAEVIERSDIKQIETLETVFLDLGYQGNNVFVQALIVYIIKLGI